MDCNGAPRIRWLVHFFQEVTMTSRFSSTRRTFMIQVSTVASAALVAQEASAQAMVSETDPQAAGLGYKADASKVDKAKFPKYAAGQACGSCALYQGKPADASGNCGLFPGKQVAGKGWCSAYAKKA
jgi:High potential iron-sulfur protein